jgi:L-asparaginase II
MADPISVVVTRGGVVEARHRVHAVAVRGGAVVASAGDAHLLTFLRSSVAARRCLVRAGPTSTTRDRDRLRLPSSGVPDQIAAVRRPSLRAPAGGTSWRPGRSRRRSRTTAPASYAGFLALCRARGCDSAGYRLPGHPLQQAMLAEVAAAAEVEPASLPTATDGCGVLTFALPLDRCAHLFGRLPELDGGERVMRAMRAHPEMLRGPVAADAMVIGALDGWVAKGGAEGLFCACSPDGLGIALKVEDGAFRAIRPALASFLRVLGVETGELGIVTVDNSRGEVVGEVIACL